MRFPTAQRCFLSNKRNERSIPAQCQLLGHIPSTYGVVSLKLKRRVLVWDTLRCATPLSKQRWCTWGRGGGGGGSPTTCKQTPTKFPSPNYSNYMERSGELPSKPKRAVSCNTATRSWSHSGSSIDTLYTVTMVVTITEVDRSSLRTYSTGAVQRNKGSLRFFLIHTVW